MTEYRCILIRLSKSIGHFAYHSLYIDLEVMIGRAMRYVVRESEGLSVTRSPLSRSSPARFWSLGRGKMRERETLGHLKSQQLLRLPIEQIDREYRVARNIDIF